MRFQKVRSVQKNEIKKDMKFVGGEWGEWISIFCENVIIQLEQNRPIHYFIRNIPALQSIHNLDMEVTWI